MFRYAQIDETGLCYAESRLGGEVQSERLIRLAVDEPIRLGQRWVSETWERFE